MRSCWSLSPSTSLSKTDFQNCKGSLTVRGARVFASFLMKMLRGGVCEDEFLVWVSNLRRIIETTRVVAPVKMKPMMTPGPATSGSSGESSLAIVHGGITA